MPYSVDESWCLFKGRMFYPHDQQAVQDFFAEGCLHGTWLMTENDPKQKSFLPLDKQHWLSEINNYYGALQPAPNDLKHSLCMAEIVEGKEVQRSFFLPEDFWDEVITPSCNNLYKIQSKK